MKKQNKSLMMSLSVLGLVVIAALGYWAYYIQQPGKLDNFAQCLEAKGAKFYGAFWCPHCQAQKALFGKSKSLLPYVECSTPDQKDQTQICKDNKIEGYPTWIFADGSRNSSKMTLEQLAEKTGCSIN